LNIKSPSTCSNEKRLWPQCSFFGVYDGIFLCYNLGHGGSEAAAYLRDNLHQMIIKDTNFPWDPV